MEIPAAQKERLLALDRLRGLVMALMVIDHVRVFAGVPAGGATAGVFFTRWVTHFCAPVFFFAAGAGVWFYARRHGGAARFLATRGLWLILLEFTLLRFLWTFNGDVAHVMAGVIWALGACMLLCAVLVRLPRAWTVALGLVLVFGHDLLDVGAIAGKLDGGALAALWKFAYVGFFAGPVALGDGGSVTVLYSLVPWLGVMLLGHAFGAVLALERARRERWCLVVGLAATVLFLVLRGFGLYGDPSPWHAPPPPGVSVPPLFAFLGTSKYPASLQFLLMTLGPSLALVPLLERVGGAAGRVLTVFGRVPFFFYLLHLPLVHGLALVVSRLREGRVNPWLFENHPMGASPVPEGYAWSLPQLYLVWAVACIVLWFACRWFAGVKERRRDPWLSYL
jgi:uncharacterized membrane protein